MSVECTTFRHRKGRTAGPSAGMLHRALAALLLLGLAQAVPALEARGSAYLALHVDDPVGWRDWGPEAFEAARADGRLVLVSSGYFACHWCHVMHGESYRDPDLAALIRRVAIPVKIDRELRPGLDAYLLEFVRRTRGHAGWPLHVFLTPEGYPLAGLTYAPPGEFRSFLERLERRWQADPERLSMLARSAAGSLRRGRGPRLDAAAVEAAVERFVAAAEGAADELAGGFGRTSKFPSSPQLLALLRLAEGAVPRLRGHLELTLDAMAAGGLRDHLGGGFFRYTTRPDWLVPHFEKMLYDNALLARVYLRGAEVLGRPGYREVAFEALDFVLRELALPGGGYAGSLSALDAGGREGGAYLWSDTELEALLAPEQRAVAARVWGLSGAPAQAGGHLPVAAATPEAAAAALGLPAPEARAHLAQARAALLAARAARGIPRDERVLMAWNGLLLRALAEAEAAGGEGFAPAADALARDLLRWIPAEGPLPRAVRAGMPLGSATLADHAYLADGLAAWSDLRGEAQAAPARAAARRLVTAALARFRGDGGWRHTAQPLLPGHGNMPALPDGPLPSPSAVLLEAALTLGMPLDLPPPRDSAGLRDDPFAYGTWIDLLRRELPRLSARKRGRRDLIHG